MNVVFISAVYAIDGSDEVIGITHVILSDKESECIVEG
jgi:hypothetical protein